MAGKRYNNSKPSYDKKSTTKTQNRYADNKRTKVKASDDFYFGDSVILEEEKPKKSIKKIVWWIVLIFFIIAFAVSAYFIISEMMKNAESAQTFEDISDMVVETPEIDDMESVPEDVEIITITPSEKYESLINSNSDFVAWLKIEGTSVDYPIMQTVSSPDYYLTRNFYKEYDDNGVPYIDEACVLNYSNNLLLHGHNMITGAMFGDLDKYLDKSFYDEYNIIQFDTLENFETYQIISVFRTVDMPDSGFPYYQYIHLDTQEQFDEYINGIKNLEEYDTGVSAQFGDKLISLSTCEYSSTNGRLVVVAKQISSSPSIETT